MPILGEHTARPYGIEDDAQAAKLSRDGIGATRASGRARSSRVALHALGTIAAFSSTATVSNAGDHLDPTIATSVPVLMHGIFGGTQNFATAGWFTSAVASFAGPCSPQSDHVSASAPSPHRQAP
jgi:hypothetical protein